MIVLLVPVVAGVNDALMSGPGKASLHVDVPERLHELARRVVLVLGEHVLAIDLHGTILPVDGDRLVLGRGVLLDKVLRLLQRVVAGQLDVCLRACETQGRSGRIRQRQPFRLDAAQNNVSVVAGGELDVRNLGGLAVVVRPLHDGVNRGDLDVLEVFVHETAQRARAVLKVHDVEANCRDGLERWVKLVEALHDAGQLG